MKIDVASVSQRGGRTHQQHVVDFLIHGISAGFVVADAWNGGLTNEPSSAERVANNRQEDSVAGELAAQEVGRQLLKAFKENTMLSNASLEAALTLANTNLLFKKRGNSRLKDVSASAGMLRFGYVVGDADSPQLRAMWSHVGNSRIYHFRGNRLLSVTSDTAVSGRLGLSGQIEPIHSALTEVFAGDVFLLCTQGFWRELEVANMELMLRRADSCSEWLAELGRLLVNRVGNQLIDYGALVVRITELGNMPAIEVVQPAEVGVRIDRSDVSGSVEAGDARENVLEPIAAPPALVTPSEYEMLLGPLSGSGAAGSSSSSTGSSSSPVADAGRTEKPIKRETPSRSGTSSDSGPVWHDFSDEADVGFFSFRSVKLWLTLLTIGAVVAALYYFIFVPWQEIKNPTPKKPGSNQTVVEKPADQQSLVPYNQAKIGDYVQFGRYREQPLIWRVIHVDQAGNPLLFSDQILTFRAFDAAGEKHADENRKQFGSNRYDESTLRLWLNAEEKSISWPKNAPDELANHLQGGANPYAKESGFLADANFSAAERTLIQPKTHRAVLNWGDRNVRDGGFETHLFDNRFENALTNVEKAFYKNATDRVFLLSVEEVKRYVFDRQTELGESYYLGRATGSAVKEADPSAKVTETGEAGAPQPGESMNEASNETSFAYWLNSASDGANDKVRVVTSVGTVDHQVAYNGYTGVRPALVLNRANVKLTADGTGTLEKPFVVKSTRPSK